jgi:hypothetical protein|tara:strand:+ start:2382 stop:2672 length:291 start_codon:yes stop_codon:yes gene_type:complete
MAIPSPSNFPGALDTTAEQPSPLAATELDDTNFLHDKLHTNHSGALIALQQKMGISSSLATDATTGQVLTISAAGSSAWATLNGTADNIISNQVFS